MEPKPYIRHPGNCAHRMHAEMGGNSMTCADCRLVVTAVNVQLVGTREAVRRAEQDWFIKELES